MAAPITVSTQDLEKSYSGKQVVNKVNVNVAAGEVVGLLGPNGAGKTTTFYMIVGLIPASGGQVLVGNIDITDYSMHRRSRMGIGYLPQEPSVFRNLSVQDNIKAIVETLPVSRIQRKELVDKHLEELSLTHIAKQKAYTLSGGERRRLEISRALVTEPKFLLMDEPFSGVDPINVAEVQKIVLELSDKGIGILITDHNVRETLSIVDRAYLLHNGEVLREGTSDFLTNDEVSREFYLGENFNM
ncbi:MAG: LPS export ABC transporter ATP-binding protein [Verrucomicrobiae bacterium]|nr:LPS export ABC transporter ATP-binding protein [Verrucomicrobiae bacterium]